jgi:hypothetical protein
MNKPRQSALRRDGRRGAIAIVVAASLTTLFGFGALAVDAGYWYQRSRMLQAVADSAVSAGMPALVAGNSATASTNATTMANANGYAGGNLVVDVTVANQLSVTVKYSAPSFFSRILGLGATRLLTKTAVGQITASGPAILGLGGCGSGGVTINTGFGLTFQGNVESNGPLTFSDGPTPVTGTGFAESPCAGSPAANPAWNTFTGGIGAGGPFTNPFAGVTLASFTCTYGTTATPGDPTVGHWTNSGGGLWTLDPGTYCTTDTLFLIGSGSAFSAAGVTLVSASNVNVGANGISSLSAAAGSPNGIAIYADGGCSGNTVQIGNQTLTITGSVYAPNGCINTGGDSITINGSIIGNTVNLGAGPAGWTFNPTGSGSGGGWQMLR